MQNSDIRFNSDIDNISSESEVKNYMIGVILGDKDIRSGVIQLINKQNGQEITNYDVQRFNAMRNLIGSWVENVTDLAITINKIITIQGALTTLNGTLEQWEKSLWVSNLEKQFNKMMLSYHRDFAPLVQAFLGDQEAFGSSKTEIEAIEENPVEENAENE